MADCDHSPMSVLRAFFQPREWVIRFFNGLAHQSIRHPLGVLVVVLLATLVAVPGMMRLKLRTDGHALVAQDAPAVVFDQRVRAQFGIEDQIVILVRSRHPDGIFNADTIQLVRDLTSAAASLPGIDPASVTSLATEPGLRMRSGSLIHETLLELPLRSKAELDQLRDDLRRIELYNGTLIANDGQSTVILVGIPAAADRAHLYQQILLLVSTARDRLSRNTPSPLKERPSTRLKPGSLETEHAPMQDEIAVTGAPVGEALLGIHILEDLGVPKRLLGTSTRSHSEAGAWRWPTTIQDLKQLVTRHVGLVPVTASVMMLIFLLSFRNVLAMLLPLPGMLVTILLMFGFMGWVGIPIYLTLAVMPVLLIATGVTNDVYLFSRYFTLLRERSGVGHLELLDEAFASLVCPVVNTSLTACVGFLSFGFSPLTPVRAFGLCTGGGVLLGLVCSCTLVPATLALVKPAWLLSPKQSVAATPTSALASWFAKLGLAAVRWRWAVIVSVLVATLLTPFGLRRLIVQDSWTNAFDPGSEFRRATSLVNEHFDGMHILLVSLDEPKILAGEVSSNAMTRDGIVLPRGLVMHPSLIAGSAITITVLDKSQTGGSNDPPPRAVCRSHIEMAYGLGNNIATRVPARDVPTNFWQEFAQNGRAKFEVVIHTQLLPEVIHAIQNLGAFIRERRQYAVGGVITAADYLSTTRFMTRPNDPDARVLPDDPAQIKLMWDYYGLARGQQRLHQIVDTNYWESLTTVFLKDANFVDTAKLMGELRQYEQEHLAPQGIKLGFAGDVAVSQSLIQGIVTTQLQSLIWSFVGIYLVTALLGGSWRWGIFCVLPSALAVLIKLAIMGWLGIPLGVATSMFAAMTLGIGVNCAIQLLEGFGQARLSGLPIREALGRTMALTGPPALVNTVAVSLGFGVLMLSQVPANARLGLLVVLGLVECFVVSLLVLPVLLHRWPLYGPVERETSSSTRTR